MASAKAAAMVESTVHDYKLLASIDFRLTESLIDKDGMRSHKAIAPENVISFSDQDNLYRFLEANFTTSFQSVDYKPSVDAFLSDTDRGYCGFSVVANTKIKKRVWLCLDW